MNETTVNWMELQLFLAVAREGGLAPAARLTGSSAPTLGRRMLALERSLERELFIRHDRGYELTPDGRKLLDDLSDIEVNIDRSTALPGESSRPLVKVSAGTWTTLALLEHLSEITGEPADIKLRFVSGEALFDIAHREVIVGFRNDRPTEEGLAGRKLSRVEFAPYASASSVEGWIRVLAATPSARWLDKKIGSDVICEVNSPRNSLDLALAGKGKALLPTFIGDRYNGLHRIGDTIPELAHDQWIVTHQDDRHLPEVRRAIDRMCRVLKTRPASAV